MRTRLGVLAVAAALLAAACGDGGSSTAAPPATGGGGFPVTVEHLAGSTEVPAEPARVVSLGDYADLDNLLALGVTPAAYGFTNSWDTGLSPWQADADLDGVEQLDATGDLSLEAVAAARPDLIVGMEYPVVDLFDDLSGLAPTIGLGWSEPWRDSLRTVAAAVGREERAEELIGEVEAAIADAAGQLAGVADTTIMIGSYYGDVLYVQGDASPMVTLFREAGLTVETTTAEPLDELSLEQVDVLDGADVVLSLATDPAATAEAEASPLWQALPAVQAGRYSAVSATDSRGFADGFNAMSYAHVLPRLVEIVLAAAAGEGTPLG